MNCNNSLPSGKKIVQACILFIFLLIHISSTAQFAFTIQRWIGAWGSDGPIHTGDLNGDGKTDVFMWRASDNSWTINLSSGSGFTMQRWTGAWGSDGPIFTGDLNGDRKTDVFMWRASDNSWTINLSTGSGFTMQRWTGAWGSDGPIQTGDLNGDGKTDVFMWRDSDKSWTINLSTGAGFAMQRWTGAWGSDGPIRTGDLNGDGRTDVLMWRKSDNSWTINISNGNRFSMQRWVGGCANQGVFQIADFNGDKKDDIAIWKESLKKWSVSFSTGNGLDLQFWSGAWGSDGPVNIGDFNGDGKKDLLMWRGSDNSWTLNLGKATDLGKIATTPECFEGSKKFHTNVGWGGRALSVAISPLSEQIVWVASPTGGLFNSTDGGASWNHVDEFSKSGCFAIAICPTDPNTIIATTIEDTKTKCEGGIWVSKDGGNSWNQPYSSSPKDAAGMPKRFNAYGISFLYNTQSVYVGIDSGIAVSNDLGLNWQIITPQPGRKIKTYSILALPNKIYAYGTDGLWIRGTFSTNWYRPKTTFPNDWKWPVPNALAVSPLNSNHIFFTYSYDRLFYSVNGGDDWKKVVTNFEDYDASRQIYVRTIKPPGTSENEFDLYYAHKSAVGRKRLTWNGSDYDFSASWNKVGFNHSDPADLTVSASNPNIYFAVNDGGIEKSTDKGQTWEKSGYAASGYDAFQIYDVKSVLDLNAPDANDIYFGTQDVNLYSSGNNGISWPDAGVAVPEGGNIQGPWTKKGDSYSLNFFCVPNYQYSNPLFSSRNYSTRSPAGMNYIYYAKDNSFFTFDYDLNGRLGMYISNDGGATWPADPVLTLDHEVTKYPTITGESSNPAIIAPISLNGETGLIRIDNAFNNINADETVTAIGLPNGTVLGNFGAQFLTNICSYAVDPDNPSFIIINDVGNQEVFITENGGNDWIPRADIKQLITENNKFLFKNPTTNRLDYELMNIQISAIAFDRLNKNKILIGSAEAGILYSSDHGKTWAKIPLSTQINNVTSFSFLQNNEALVATWGRGLWKLNLPPSNDIIPYSLSRYMGRDTVPGNYTKAHRMLKDTTRHQLYLREKGRLTNSSYVIAGKTFELLGKKWLDNSSGDHPIQFLLDDDVMVPEKARYDKNGSFLVELPVFQVPGYYELRVLQLLKPEGKKEMILRFNVIPMDKERE